MADLVKSQIKRCVIPAERSSLKSCNYIFLWIPAPRFRGDILCGNDRF